VGDPELLFLDEPTTGFDPAARRGAWAVVKDLARLGKTVLLTTHYMDEAQFLADRVAVVARGQLVAMGPPAAIGGRTDAVRIRFALPEGLGVDALPLPATVEDGYAVITPAPADATRALHALTGWALERGITLGGLSVTTRSLEDVYLELVGS
jgi:ABC-2 type transport system ATP-binding protein